MKILETKIENIRGRHAAGASQQCIVRVIAPTQPMRPGCIPQPSYIHGPMVTSVNRQPRFTRSE